MKLKKIASLMLAGAMAVSMLAGCEGSANSGENNGEENQVVAASVADYANSLLSDKQKNVFKFENSSDLTAALQKVAGNSKEFTSEEIKKYSDLFAYNQKIVVDLLAEDLADEMKLDYNNSSTGDQEGLADTMDKGTKSVGFVYALSGKMAQDSAVQLIINYWASTTMDNDKFFPATISTHNLNCEYTADISAVKVTAPDDSNVSTWVVAIVVTQTATEAANV
ncbi:MAG TPA: hypothetical protein H9996_03045 [Candidatus Faecalibacterium avium]|nr:hypothetical protein [Candidatus Faecalibacterium avium]